MENKASTQTDKPLYPLTRDALKDRIRGVILGAACGNSLGGSCVGLNHKEILATAGARLRDFAPGLSRSLVSTHKAGAWLSDNYLAIALAESVIANSGQFSKDDVKARFTKLLEDEKFLASEPGSHCLTLLRRMADGITPLDSVPEALHISSVARTFAVGLLPGDAQRLKDISVEQAKLSQADGRVLAASAVFADSVHFFLLGNRLDTENEVRAFVVREYQLAENIDSRFAESWDDVAPDLDYVNPAKDVPYSLLNIGSEVGELFPTAVGIFLIFRHSLEDAVCAAAVAGGDTDTLALIVGALSGAYHGQGAIPERWLNEIAERERLEKVADALVDLWKL